MTSYPPPLRKASRTGIWIGVGLMVAAVAVAVVAGVLVWRLLAGEVEVIDADGTPHEVTLPADETYGTWVEPARPATCRVVDAEGGEVTLERPDGTYEVNQWDADRSFETGSGTLTVTCTPGADAAGTEVRLGPLPSIPGLVGLVFGGVCLGMLLGTAGLVVIVVTVVRRSRLSPA
ncbi:hypothetical protein CFH99_17085 [Nocardioides aromaticivorans]|uniref:DUF3592 domain-containing protein n=1 Tax=Nocardioides aromaticivorans TaxID=200618 RepID=A0ABX7PNW5_9ACTN|nr:hypothetical protein [Nocardioides aromaticivorans]QSR27338.1 hypothetical protein CFH99_17085 [Nocardioides aromaticivorans]